MSDKDVTPKTVFLVALATGLRRNELHTFPKDVRWFEGDLTAISPKEGFLSKSHLAFKGLGALESVVIPVSPVSADVSSQNSLLCPVSCLRHYLDRVSKFRAPSQHRLLFLFRRVAPRSSRVLPFSVILRMLSVYFTPMKSRVRCLLLQ